MHVQMQVEGVRGLPNLRAKIAASGPTVLWHGSLGAMSANFVGHYPWCVCQCHACCDVRVSACRLWSAVFMYAECCPSFTLLKTPCSRYMRCILHPTVTPALFCMNLHDNADGGGRRRFFTYNYLNAWLPKYEDDLPKRLLRSAFIGFSASFVSDTRHVHPHVAES